MRGFTVYEDSVVAQLLTSLLRGTISTVYISETEHWRNYIYFRYWAPNRNGSIFTIFISGTESILTILVQRTASIIEILVSRTMSTFEFFVKLTFRLGVNFLKK